MLTQKRPARSDANWRPVANIQEARAALKARRRARQVSLSIDPEMPGKAELDIKT